MTRIDRKRLWFFAALAGSGLVYFAQMTVMQPRGLRSASSEPTNPSSISSEAVNAQGTGVRDGMPEMLGDLDREGAKIAGRSVFAEEIKRSGNLSAAALPRAGHELFLDAEIQPVWVNQAQGDPIPINVGDYLDPNAESFDPSENHAIDSDHASVNVGEYMDPDPVPYTQVITANQEHETNESNVGRYLDPDTENLGPSSVFPSKIRHVGSYLEADI